MRTDDEIRAAAERLRALPANYPWECVNLTSRAWADCRTLAHAYLNPWRPMETADKDADRVLVYADHWRFASWGRTASGNRKGWFDKESGFMIFPTHWTDLPGPPCVPLPPAPAA